MLCVTLARENNLQPNLSPMSCRWRPAPGRWSPRSQPLSHFCFALMRCGKRIILMLKADCRRYSANEDLIFIEAWSKSRSSTRLLDPQPPRAHTLLLVVHSDQARQPKVDWAAWASDQCHCIPPSCPRSTRVVCWPLGSVFYRSSERAYCAPWGLVIGDWPKGHVELWTSQGLCAGGP